MRQKFKSKRLIVCRCMLCSSFYLVEHYEKPRTKYCSFECRQIACAKASAKVNIARYRGTGTKTYVKENGRHQHRVVAELKLGRPLVRGEIVHHIDGNKKNNTPENLMVMTQADHMRLHHKEMLAVRKVKAGY